MIKKDLKNRDFANDIVFKPLGGVSEVEATSYFINWKGVKILIDAGKRRGEKIVTPEYDEIKTEIDFLFLTHVHQDHVGSVMEYYDYFEIKHIIATRETRDTLRPILKDTKKHIPESREKYYQDQQINEFINQVQTFAHNQSETLEKDLQLKFSLVKTSHLIGSSGVLLEDKDYKLFITSDFTESNKFFHPKTDFGIVYDKEIDTVVTETTYGSKEEGDKVLKETTLSNLEYYINRVFNGTEDFPQGGNLFIPAFSNGRTQEIILALLKLIKEERISLTTKIRIPFKFAPGGKPLAQDCTIKYFSKYQHILEEELGVEVDNDFEAFIKNNLDPINIWENSEDFFAAPNQILIASPGMLGQAEEESDEDIYQVMQVALDIIESQRHGIIFAGYQAPGTLGGEIQRMPYGSKLRYHSRNWQRNTPHIYKVTFPGHVSAKGLLNLINDVGPDNVILTHGDINSSRSIAKSIQDREINVLIPEREENIYLMDNQEKTFFSPHHKFSNLILSFAHQDSQNIDISENNLLANNKLEDLDVIQIANYISNKYSPELNHIELVIKEEEQQSDFYKKLEQELKDKGYSIDIITINTNVEDKEHLMYKVLEVISETALNFREKFRVFFAADDFLYTLPYNIVAQLFNEDLFYVNNQAGVIKIPNLPIDLNIKEYMNYRQLDKINKETIFTHQGHDGYEPSDFYEVLDRIYYYKFGARVGPKGRSLTEILPNQLPLHNKKSVVFKKDLFAVQNNTLWGRVENIYDIKNYKAVEILMDITNKLNERIEKFQFTNYIHDYDHHKHYGEVISYEERKIYYRLILENGIQYLTIHLGFNVDVRKAVKTIGEKKE